MNQLLNILMTCGCIQYIDTQKYGMVYVKAPETVEPFGPVGCSLWSGICSSSTNIWSSTKVKVGRHNITVFLMGAWLLERP